MPTNASLSNKYNTNLSFSYGAPFSRNSLASLIFVARYGLPPQSGWFRSISCLCFLRTISFVTPRSLCATSSVYYSDLHYSCLRFSG
jgi:hypothetical protein